MNADLVRFSLSNFDFRLVLLIYKTKMWGIVTATIDFYVRIGDGKPETVFEKQKILRVFKRGNKKCQIQLIQLPVKN